MNPRCAPARVRVRHRANQHADVGGHGRSTHTAPALPGSPQPEAPSVPGDDGLRLDDDERRSPAGPDAGDRDPEPPVRFRHPQPPRPRALQHLQLMPYGQQFELKRGAGTCRCSEDQEEREQHRHHAQKRTHRRPQLQLPQEERTSQ